VFATSAVREFRLTRDGVQCGGAGLGVGGVALLARSPSPSGAPRWGVRPHDEIERELSARYGLAVEIERKGGGLACVAGALNKGDVALAQITALLLQFPDPPPLGKGAGGEGSLASLAEQLFCSSLLKGDWNPDLHPRTGTPPSPGQFAPVPKEAKPPRPQRAGWPSKEFNAALRVAAVDFALKLAETDPRVRTAALILELTLEAISWLRRENPDEDLESSQQRVEDQIYANLQPPKTQEELQMPPQDHFLGYELHHIVEQDDDNIAKDDFAIAEGLLKFGYEALNDPSNLVYVPRLKHEQITALYNSKYLDNPAYPLTRQVVGALDFNAQREAGLEALREAGLEALREAGVLK
jgi:hypothetical protein